MLRIPGVVGASQPFMAEIANEISDDLNVVFAAFPIEFYAPVCLASALQVTAIEISPGHPVAVGGGSKIGAIDLEA